jgi:hypothetical protein
LLRIKVLYGDFATDFSQNPVILYGACFESWRNPDETLGI